MADLTELPLEFPEGIRQHEPGEAATGGPPNLSNGTGLDNYPQQQLAKRTRWLRDRVDTLLGYFTGGKLKDTVLPDTALRKTGGTMTGDLDMGNKGITRIQRLRFGSGDELRYSTQAGLEIYENDVLVARIGPDSVLPGTLEVGGDQVWRDAIAPNALTSNGRQVLPNGLRLYWGRVNNIPHDHTIVFPIAFPTACLAFLPMDGDAAGSASHHVVTENTKSRTGVTVSVFDGPSGNVATGTTTVSYIAIGH